MIDADGAAACGKGFCHLVTQLRNEFVFSAPGSADPVTTPVDARAKNGAGSGAKEE